MKLLTKELERKLIANYEENQRLGEEGKFTDHVPVVKFFGGSSATWLLTEYCPESGTFFGLCYLSSS